MSEYVSALIDEIVMARSHERARKRAGTSLDADASGIIEAIVSAYHRDWENQKLDRARALLSRLSEGIPVPALAVCGHGTQETRYTKYLAYFLDGSKPHGLGTRYLDGALALLRQLHPEVPSDVDTARSNVTPEMPIGLAPGIDGRPCGCDCDIVVACESHVIFIEQKIKSGESPNQNSDDGQLRRYDIAIEGNPKFQGVHTIRVFLAPRRGKEGLSSTRWLGLAHHDLAEVGLAILREGGLSDTARENLKRFIVDILVGPYEKVESEIWQLENLAREATAIAVSEDRLFTCRLRFDQAVSRNETFVDLLMED